MATDSLVWTGLETEAGRLGLPATSNMQVTLHAGATRTANKYK